MALTQVTQPGIGDQAVSLDKLLHGTSSNNGKFLRANNGADPTFETIDLTSLNASNLSSGTIPSARLSATDLLTLLKTVDGVGSGLDADLLDGQSSSFYQNATNLTSGTLSNGIFPSILPAISGQNLTNLNASQLTSGTIPTNRFGIDTIPTSSIAAGALPTDVTVNSANIVDGSIVDADISGSASISGSKVNPNFGSQTIQTTGNLQVGGTISGVTDLTTTTTTATDLKTNANNNVAPVIKNSAGVEIARLCKAYVNFNGQSSGTNKTIRDSFNVTTVTDQAVGYYQVNFDRAMADADYTALVTGDLRSPNTRQSGTDCNFYTTQLVRVSAEDNNSQYGQGRADVQIMCVCILGNT